MICIPLLYRGTAPASNHDDQPAHPKQDARGEWVASRNRQKIAPNSKKSQVPESDLCREHADNGPQWSICATFRQKNFMESVDELTILIEDLGQLAWFAARSYDSGI
jgi:hypothetical protein